MTLQEEFEKSKDGLFLQGAFSDWAKWHYWKKYSEWLETRLSTIAQQPLCGSPEGSPKPLSATSCNRERCVKCAKGF